MPNLLNSALVSSLLLLAWNATVNAADVCIVVSGTETAAAKIAISRLQDYGRCNAEVIASKDLKGTSNYRLIINLGLQSLPELKGPEVKPDSYAVKTTSQKPISVVASGTNERGMLYAAYHLADLLRAEADLSSLDIFRQPRIPERYVTFGATRNARKDYDPDQHWRTLNEAPGFGYNGIVIYPSAGTPIGRQASPVLERKDGALYLDDENTKQWRRWFTRLRDYQLSIMMTVPPAIPPGYANEQIRTFYGGGPEPEGYIPALQAHFRRYLELLARAYPELDRYMFNSTEGATFGRNERFFAHPNRRYPNASYLRNNEKVMRAYFEVLKDFFGPDLKKVAYWTHCFGLNSEGIAKMREVLFDYPEVTIIEDDFWNNNLWPMDLPAMAYLPLDLRARVSRQNPFAIYQIASDGEYYGGGSLPNAYPGSHIRTAREAVERNACMMIQRLDLHDRTSYGTAFGSMKIVPLAASRQVWEPTPPEPEIWQEWAASRFGRKAAGHVIKALQESKTVLQKGLSANGIDLLAVGSEFNPRLWKVDGSGLTRFYLFGKPGRILVRKNQGDVIQSSEYTAWQMNTRTISIADFRRNQEAARNAVTRGLAEIQSAQIHLSAADYEMLHEIFVNGQNVLKAMRLLGEAAYATNILLENFDKIENPQQSFDEALAELEAYLDEEKLSASMTENLSEIVQHYKAVALTAQKGARPIPPANP